MTNPPAHSAVVRITHWINALSFLGLLISGIAILLAHPRLYWGETGNLNMPAWINLPLPMVLNGQNGWGRYLHFLSAWFCILNGMLYVASGVMSRHFRQNLVPNTGPMGSRAQHEQPGTYAVPQQITYLAVVFVVLPLMIWTGLAMSPAITSVFPLIVNLLGGQQSARTMHFFAAAALVLFLFVHLVMVYITGFAAQIRAMITGRSVPAKGAA